MLDLFRNLFCGKSAALRGAGNPPLLGDKLWLFRSARLAFLPTGNGLNKNLMAFLLQPVKVCQRGFTLLEAVLAMGISSMLILGAMKTFPQLNQRTQWLNQGYQLNQLLRQTMLTIKKDLRRAGFCNGNCAGKAITLSQATGEQPNSCVIVAYDLNLNGRFEAPGDINSEYFGYRLHQGMLQSRRGVSQCDGAGWENMLDPNEVRLSCFQLTEMKQETGGRLMVLKLAASGKNAPSLPRQLTACSELTTVVKLQ